MNPLTGRPMNVLSNGSSGHQTKITNYYQPKTNFGSNDTNIFSNTTSNNLPSFNTKTTSDPSSPIYALSPFNGPNGNSGIIGSSSLMTSQQQNGQWRQLPYDKAIKVDAREAPWVIDHRTNKENRYQVANLTYQEPYRKSYLSTIEIRMFTYLQRAGLLAQYLDSGYAREAMEKIKRASKFSSLFGQNNNQPTNGPIGSSTFSNNSQSSSAIGIFGNNQQKAPFGQTQGQGTSPFTTFNQQSANIFNTQQQQTNIFNQQPQNYQHNPFTNHTTNLPEVQYNSKVVDSMKGPVLHQMGQALMQGKMYPLLSEFLKSYGVNENVLEILFSMNLEIEEIQQFLARSYFLYRICQEQSSKMNFLSDYYQKLPGDTRQQRSYQQPLIFPHFSRYPYEQDKFSKYVDYILEHTQYTWQERMLHEAWKQYLKDNISIDPYKQQIIKQYLNELELIDRKDFVAEQYRKRERTFQNQKQPQVNSVWASEEAIRNQGLNTVPMRIKPYYLG